MPRLRFSLLLSTMLAASAGGYLLACSGDDNGATPGPNDAGPDAADDGSQPDTYVPIAPGDAAVQNCTLDNGSDPVGLCIQKLVLAAEHQAAVGDAGVASSWDSLTGVVDTSAGYDVHDAVAYGATLAHYLVSAQVYGDTEILPMVTRDLARLSPIVQAGLATLPAEYGGELYQNLRAFAGGLRYIDYKDDANKIDAIAEAYARAIYTTYFRPVPPPPPFDGGASDAGDAGAVDASPSDAAPSDAALDASDAAVPPGPDAGGPVVDGVLGSDNHGQLDYDAEDNATGALALMDMSLRHTADETVNALAWQRAARAIFDHLWARARDSQLGLYYCKLTTSGDPAHDTLQMWPQPPDMLSSDTQARIALTLLHAQELVTNNAAVFPSFGGALLEQHGEDAINKMNGTPSFWDPTPLPTNDAGSGYFEGYVPSTSTMVTTKTVRANALILAVLHRANLITGHVPAYQINALRTLLLTRTPRNSSLLSAVVGQDSYLERTTADFNVPSGDAGPSAAASAYTAASNHVACEGLDEQWAGSTH